jgi:hypothetical protein
MISKGLGDPMDQLRRKFLQGAAGMLLPLFFGAGSKNALALDEVVSHGGNIITACWHLMKGKEINAAEELLDACTPTLLHLAFSDLTLSASDCPDSYTGMHDTGNHR